MKTDKKRIGEMLIDCIHYDCGICTANAPIYKVTDRVYPSKEKCPRMNSNECYGRSKPRLCDNQSH